MKKNIIFVTGFIGSDRAGRARQLAAQNGMEFVLLDQEIEAKDGRSIRRIAMMMGEHEVRNKEYEALKALLEREESASRGGSPDREGTSDRDGTPDQEGLRALPGLVVACSDGIVLDDECLSLLCQGHVVIADEALTPEDLWEQTKADPNPAYAFLSADEEAEQYQRYLALYQARMPIYRRISI